MKSIFLFLYIFVTISSVSFAQNLTIGQSNFTPKNIGKSYLTKPNSALEGTITSEIEAQMKALIQKEGQGQVWDFTVFQYTETDTRVSTYFSSPSAATGGDDPRFALSNYVIREFDTEFPEYPTWRFITSTDTAFYFNGETEAYSGTLLKTTANTTPHVWYKFPMQFGSSWTVSIFDTTINENDVGSGTPVTMPIRFERYVTIDGEGSLILPGGTVPALRLKKTLIRSIQNVPQHSGTLYDTNVSYEFMSAEHSSIARLAEDHSHPFNFTAGYLHTSPATEYYTIEPVASVEKQTISHSHFGLSLGANPVTTPTQVSFTLSNNTNVEIQLMDVLGRGVRSLYNGQGNSGENTFLLDPTTLSNGSYLLRITSGNVSEMQKIIIAK